MVDDVKDAGAAGADAGADKGANAGADAGKNADAGAGGAGKDGATLLAAGGDAGADAGKTNIPVEFPEDWRNKLAGDNAEAIKTLSRYTSPKAFFDAHMALRTKMSAGELKAVTPFPTDGDDAAKATWRKENGIPEKADGYEPKVDGLVFGDADKPMLDSFKAHAFGKNWSPAQFNEALGWYANEQQQIKARQDTADETFRSESKDSLYTEWGPQDFKANINAVKNLLSSAPTDFADRLLGARLAPAAGESVGKLLGDDPGALKWLSSLAREMNPAATLVPPGTSDAGKSVQDELNEIRRVTRETPEKVTPAMEKRQTDLIAVMDKMKSRAA